MGLIGEIAEISKISSSKIVVIIFLFISTVCPGILLIYLHKNELLLALDFGKIIIFSIAITLPFLVVSFFYYAAVLYVYNFLSIEKLSGISDEKFLYDGSLHNMIALYIVIAITWFNRVSVMSFVKYFLILHTCMLIYEILSSLVKWQLKKRLKGEEVN